MLAVLVLLSTMSWTVDKHLCMGRVMDISFFGGAKGCGMDEAFSVIGMENKENHCCDDESFTQLGQDDLTFSWSGLNLENQVFWVAFYQSYLDFFVPLKELLDPSEKYPPPILVEDIHVLDQVFLI